MEEIAEIVEISSSKDNIPKKVIKLKIVEDECWTCQGKKCRFNDNRQCEKYTLIDSGQTNTAIISFCRRCSPQFFTFDCMYCYIDFYMNGYRAPWTGVDVYLLNGRVNDKWYENLVCYNCISKNWNEIKIIK